VFAVRAGRDGERIPTGRPVGPPPVATATPPPVEPTAEPTVEVNRGIRLEVTVTDAPAWIRVLRGDEVLHQGTVEPGFSRTFRAGPGGRLEFRTGNAGVVRLILNGKRLGIAGEPGGIYEKAFVMKDGRAVAVDAG
jgi:cytoskeleton protein RodZ